MNFYSQQLNLIKYYKTIYLFYNILNSYNVVTNSGETALRNVIYYNCFFTIKKVLKYNLYEKQKNKDNFHFTIIV